MLSQQSSRMDSNRSMTSIESLEEAVKLEKKLVNAMLGRLFKTGVSQALFNSLYPPTVRTPQFLDCDSSAWPMILDAYRARLSERAAHTETGDDQNDDSVWCKIAVNGLAERHFEKDVFPPFEISIVQLDGNPLPRATEDDGNPKPMADLRVQIGVQNKWANVTQEVLKDVEFVRTLKDGRAVVSDLVFQEISLKHGGHFTLTIDPIDYKSEVQGWRSQKIIIQSVKTHSNKKRKSKHEDPDDE
eukprot:c12302_g1_i1.p1 GENE.c12302_g1_i1~~c12302_g1_i1.p1  ORF type:complete len:244 (-),score=53.26 c12302_g1_i1:339-1070(-)